MWEYHFTDCLVHHGVKGQKWGVRRYQNEDGTLTEAGRKHYGEVGKDYKLKRKDFYKERKSLVNKYYDSDERANQIAENTAEYNRISNEAKNRLRDKTYDMAKAARDADELLEDNAKLAAEAVFEANRKAYLELVDKYGEKRVNDIGKKEKRIGKAKTAAALLLLSGVTVGAGILNAKIDGSI